LKNLLPPRFFLIPARRVRQERQEIKNQGSKNHMMSSDDLIFYGYFVFLGVLGVLAVKNITDNKAAR
jgi:hypothetical protein